VLAPPFASTDRAYALKIPHDLRIGVRDFHPVEFDFVHPPIQQIRGVWPFAGENGEIGCANARVAGDAFHLGRTATVKGPPSPCACCSSFAINAQIDEQSRAVHLLEPSET
jgi:hypothetical protein